MIVKEAPIHIASVGTSPQMRKPHIRLMSNVAHSNGATTEALASGNATKLRTTTISNTG